jgi:predicted nucleic acid-binding protein
MIMHAEIDPSKKILLDADVIIHFVKGGRIGTLSQIFNNKLYLIDVVFEEVFKKSIYRTQIENMIKLHFFNEISLSNDTKVLKEYFRLSKKFGRGESACMAYCKFNQDILASSNLTDIKRYCEENGIQYLTTMDFLCEALNKGIMDKSECNLFIYKVIYSGSKLPCNSIDEYLEKK